MTILIYINKNKRAHMLLIWGFFLNQIYYHGNPVFLYIALYQNA